LQIAAAAAGAAPVATLAAALAVTELPVPAAVANGAQVFGSAVSGMARFVADSTLGDSNTYEMGTAVKTLGADFTINSTSPLTILSIPVAAGVEYRVAVWLVTQNATAADFAVFGLTGPANKPGTAQLVDFESKTSGTATVGYGASGTYTATFAGQGVAGNQGILFRATVTFNVAGTLAITGKENVAGNTVNVSAGSRLEISPVG
jgi:hypothetical protein